MNINTTSKITSYLDTTKSHSGLVHNHSIHTYGKVYEGEQAHYYDDNSCKINWSHLLRK